jgi:YidC/Oxa1 family membrane protein insertase
MDKGALIRTLVIFGLVLVVWKVIWPAMSGGSSEKPQPVPAETYVNAPDFAPDPLVETVPPGTKAPPLLPEEHCTIHGNRFEAELSNRGAALVSLKLTNPQYDHVRMITSANPDSSIERWRPLRTLFRDDDAKDQFQYDRFNWKLDRLGDRACKFTYEEPGLVRVEKTVKAGQRPYELAVDTTITNLADAPKKHDFSIETFAFYKNIDVKGHLGRVSPFVTDLVCANGKNVVRKNKDSFKEGWISEPAADRFAAVSNYYFASALIPEAGGTPGCRILAEDWLSEGQKRDDDQAGAVYHARLEYAPRTLQKGESASYSQVAFFGPKERDILRTAGGPGKKLGDLINLGFFSPVAKVLVGSLVWIKDHVTHNWGLSIIFLTLVLRLVLFPLQWKSIKSMVGMRRLKPEIDEINKKFAGDMQAKNLAMMELYKKRGVNPLGGCLPQLIQMPVWFAMYTTLQTAVEMYHTRFLWFADLSAPDELFGSIHLPMLGHLPPLGPLPFVLGGFMILQQRIVPQQGMDPMQQKLMTWVMPLVFMVMMLFLPAALGVYMLCNSVLGIVQQLAVEKIAPRNAPAEKKIEVTVLGKDKARV